MVGGEGVYLLSHTHVPLSNDTQCDQRTGTAMTALSIGFHFTTLGAAGWNHTIVTDFSNELG